MRTEDFTAKQWVAYVPTHAGFLWECEAVEIPTVTMANVVRTVLRSPK